MVQPGSPAGRVETTRRRFLTTSVAAGASAATLLQGTPWVHASGSGTIKVGLIGCGDRGTGAAMQAMNADPGVRVIALADVFADHVQSTRQRLIQHKPEQAAVDDDHCFSGFDAYQKVIDSGVDVVLIACASRFHPDYMRAAIDAGKHVFVEKPHAIDPPGVHRVLAATEEAKKKNLCIVSGLHRRYMPEIQETVKRVRDGAIGDIFSMEVSFMRAPYKVVERDPKWSEMEWQFKTWYHFRWLSGDDVPQSLVHTLDVATWALGEKPPVSAHALAGRSASIATRYGDVFDHCAVVYEYDNGAKMYGFVRTQENCHGEVAVKLLGTKGQAGEGWVKGSTSWRREGRWTSGHQQEQIDFFAALRAGKVINNGEYMARSTLIGVMGQMAAYTGKKISWDEVWKSRFEFPPKDTPISFDMEPTVKPGPHGIYPVPMPGKTQLT